MNYAIKVTQAMRDRASDNISSKPVGNLYPKATCQITNGICALPGCNQTVEGFDDELSLSEFYISGMCQACQDMMFNED